MSSIKATKLDGDFSVGRNLSIGGKATIQGNSHLKGGLKVDGWLEAPNVKGPNKGIFSSLEKLKAEYPFPRNGWYALVGTSLPAPMYVGDNGDWVATGGTGGNMTADVQQFHDDLEALDNNKLNISDLAQSMGGSVTTAMSQDSTTKALSGLLTGQKASETPFITRYRSDNNGNLWDTFNSELNDMAKSEAAVINGLIKYYLSGLRVDVVNRVVDSSTGINRRLTQVVTGNLFVNDSGDLAFDGNLDRSYWRVYAKGVWSPWAPVVKDIVGIYPTTLDVRGLSGTATPAQIAELNKIKAAINARQLCVLGPGTAGSDPETLIISVTTTGNVSSGLTYYVKGISTKGIIYSASCTVTYDIWGDGDSYGNWQTGRTDLNALNTLGESITSPISQDAVTKALGGLLTGQEADKSPFISLYRDGNGDQVWESLNREISDINTMATAKYNGLIRFYLSGLRVDVVNRVVDSSTGSRRLTQVVTGNLFVNDSGDLAFDGNVDQSFKRLYADGAWGAWTPLSSGGFAGVPEAPADGSTYGRKNKGWVKTIGRSGTGNSAEVFNDYTNNTAAGRYSHIEGVSTGKAYDGSTIPTDKQQIIMDWYMSPSGFAMAYGQASHVEGSDCLALSNAAHAEGIKTLASNDGAHAEGTGTNAAGQYAHAEGQNTTANAQACHSEGAMCVCNGIYGHVEGFRCMVENTSGHAEGYITYCFSSYGHSEGKQTSSVGFCSHSEGYGEKIERSITITNIYNIEGDSSSFTADNISNLEDGVCFIINKIPYAILRIEGDKIYVNRWIEFQKQKYDIIIMRGCSYGDHSHHENESNSAIGRSSSVSGTCCIAYNQNEFACGQYNYSEHSETTSKRTLFSIGIGTDRSRLDGVEMKLNGDLYIFGIGGYNGNNSSEAKTIQAVISELLNKIQELESK